MRALVSAAWTVSSPTPSTSSCNPVVGAFGGVGGCARRLNGLEDDSARAGSDKDNSDKDRSPEEGTSGDSDSSRGLLVRKMERSE